MQTRSIFLKPWALLALLLVSVSVGAQTVPQLINYQGRLADSSGHPLNATVDLTFRFYGVATGDTPLYLSVLQEDVVVSGGIYSILIGSGTIIPGTERLLVNVFRKHSSIFMAVAVNGGTEMTPRSTIGSVPFSLSTDLGLIDKFMQVADYDGDGHNKKYIYSGDDCDDTDALTYPGAPDNTVDGKDQDCDGTDGDPCPSLPDMSTCNGGVCCGGVCRVGAECCQSSDCSCTGTPEMCEMYDISQCMTQIGCYPQGFCFGGGICPIYMDPGMCFGNGCTWDMFCTGIHNECSTYTPSECSTQEFCLNEQCNSYQCE